MKLAKKKTAQKEKYLIFSDGSEAAVTGENGKYFLCGKTQYRRSNPNILRVEERKAAKKEEVSEDADG